MAAIESADLQALTPSWDDLRPDEYLKDGGRYRKRRHACFVAEADGLQDILVPSSFLEGKYIGEDVVNAATGVFEDLVAAGVIDPAKVVRTAIEDAASVAGLLITTEAMIAEKPRKETAPAMPAGGGMDF